MGIFERYLTVWVGLSIVAGVGLGYLFPSAFVWVAGVEYAHVILIIAVLFWVMIFPMMLNIDFLYDIF